MLTRCVRNGLWWAALVCVGLWGLAWLLAAKPEAAARIFQHSQTLSVGEAQLFHVQKPEKGLLFLLADSDGLTPSVQQQAKQWAEKSYLVALVDTPALAHLATAEGCWPLGALLLKDADFLKTQFNLPTATAPILMGEGLGAQAVYVAMAQSPVGAFHAGLSIDFCPNAASGLPAWCASGRFTPVAAGAPFLPATPLGGNWYLFQRPKACEVPVEPFLEGLNSAKLNPLDGTKQAPHLEDIDGLLDWLDPRLPDQAQSALSNSGLPLVEVPVTPEQPEKPMVILLTGDGGWAKLDKELAEHFAKQGVPTVGFDCLSYFWKKRTPEATAAALSAVINNYRAHWNKQRVLLVGYSFGADVLPFILSRLPEKDRQWIQGAVFLGLSANATFEFKLSNWVSATPATTGFYTQPELARVPWVKGLCVAGSKDTTAVCTAIKQAHINVLTMAGDHHFDEAYNTLAEHILRFAGVF